MAIAPHLYKAVRYDPVRDFAAISDIATVTQVLVTSPSSGFDSIQTLIAEAKRKPGTIQYASSGKGSTSHLTMELFAESAGISLEHIPYKGSPAAQTDIIGGRVPIMFDAAPGILANVRAGKLKAIGVSSRLRSLLFPAVPTVAESGVPGFETVGWIGLFAPRGTPGDVISTLQHSIVTALQAPEARSRIRELAFTPVGDSSEDFAKYVRSEVELWGRVVQRAKVTSG
jgi:tripartite-type tricarboxylate transporter receptor subunit TctC